MNAIPDRFDDVLRKCDARLRSDPSTGWLSAGDVPLGHNADDYIAGLNKTDLQFEYRVSPVATSDATATEWVLPLSLTAAEVRVVKAALLVEVAELEFRAKHDQQPEIWFPALNSGRRVLSALCDKANKHLLDL